MPKIFNVLIVDDHPIVVDAIKGALEHVSLKNNKIKFNVSSAFNSDDALSLIKKSKKCSAFHLAFLDMRLPPSKDKKILSGEDLGILIKDKFNDCKLIVITSINDNYRLNSIFKILNPDGLLIKSEIDLNDLIACVEMVITDPPYYSKTVLRLLRKFINNDFTLDAIDRRLLYELSNGTRMVDIPKIIPMSKGGLERRRRNIKELFEIESGDVKDIIEFAKEKGFI